MKKLFRIEDNGLVITVQDSKIDDGTVTIEIGYGEHPAKTQFKVEHDVAKTIADALYQIAHD